MDEKRRTAVRSLPGTLPVFFVALLTAYLLSFAGGVLLPERIVLCPPGAAACLGRWEFPVIQGTPFFRGALAFLQSLSGSIHGWISILTWSVIASITVMAWARFRKENWISRPLFATMPLFLLQTGIALLPRAANSHAQVYPISHGSMLLIQALLITTAVVAFRRVMDVPRGFQMSYSGPFARLSMLTLGAVFLALVTGASVRVAGVSLGCGAWPLCGPIIMPQSPGGWIDLAHRLVVGVAAVSVAWLVVQAWRAQRMHTGILVTATATGVLYVAQGLLGALSVGGDQPGYLPGLHSLSGAALWFCLVVLVVRAGLADEATADQGVFVGSTGSVWRRIRDYISLTKPIIVALLLFTTFAGMVVAAQGWPSADLVFWTLLGGALAAGGSGAINQYIDRHLDRLMTRTANRPVAAGRLMPAESLAFGVGLCLAAFFVLVAYVNLIAAFLSVVGMLYYVLLYSLLLKKTSVQNIVIGGGAGAIPPLVGWTAVTGGLDWPALLLFAVIFFWTPPHFWALAIVRRKDYQRAGVPMLPAIRGEMEARRQIWIYTLQLVAITFALPLFGLGEWLYLVSALLLGGVMLRSAWKVRVRRGNLVAWRMYRYSSMYLAFIFLALMVDALV